MSSEDSVHRSDGSVRLVKEADLDWQDGECHYRATDEQSPSEAVIGALNKCLERENGHVPVTEQPPLFEAIDPDALDALVTSLEAQGSVQFAYCGHIVTVESDGKVVVRNS